MTHDVKCVFRVLYGRMTISIDLWAICNIWSRDITFVDFLIFFIILEFVRFPLFHRIFYSRLSTVFCQIKSSKYETSFIPNVVSTVIFKKTVNKATNPILLIKHERFFFINSNWSYYFIIVYYFVIIFLLFVEITRQELWKRIWICRKAYF